jgi:hypothetical protein
MKLNKYTCPFLRRFHRIYQKCKKEIIHHKALHKYFRHNFLDELAQKSYNRIHYCQNLLYSIYHKRLSQKKKDIKVDTKLYNKRNKECIRVYYLVRDFSLTQVKITFRVKKSYLNRSYSKEILEFVKKQRKLYLKDRLRPYLQSIKFRYSQELKYQKQGIRTSTNILNLFKKYEQKIHNLV